MTKQQQSHSSPESSSWRLFCAIELPQETRAKLRDNIRKVREVCPDVAASWSRPENIHLTVKFFGDVSQKRIPTISSALSRAVQNRAPFQVTIGGSGVFPKPSLARILWIGIDDQSGKLAELIAAVQEECAAEGFEKEKWKFRPHLTIARLRKREGARKLTETHLRLKFDPAELIV